MTLNDKLKGYCDVHAFKMSLANDINTQIPSSEKSGTYRPQIKENRNIPCNENSAIRWSSKLFIPKQSASTWAEKNV